MLSLVDDCLELFLGDCRRAAELEYLREQLLPILENKVERREEQHESVYEGSGEFSEAVRRLLRYAFR